MSASWPGRTWTSGAATTGGYWSACPTPVAGRWRWAGRCRWWRKCGAVPAWAETFAPQQLTAADFLGRCHALLGLNGGARENWPRVGLEAMAAGVPLVCQNLWGWREMIVDGETGFLTDNDEEMAFRLAELAYDEALRQRIIRRAREHVEELAEPERIARQWKELLETV